MPNTITSKNLIPALRNNDYVGVDDTSNSGVTMKTTPEQQREYATVGYGSTLPVFNRKCASVKTNAANCRVLILGDSVTLGKGSLPSGTGRVNWNYASIAQRYLSAAGITCQRDYMAANGDGTSDTFDSRVTKGSSWASTGATGVGGNTFQATTNTNALSFTPTGIVNTFIVYYDQFGAGGTLSVDIDGVGTLTQSTSGANGIGSKIITASAPGIHTVNVKWSSGGSVIIQNIEAYNSTINQLQIMTAGWGGATTADISNTVNAYGPLNGLKNLAPDLTIIATGINDWGTSADTTTFTANYQALITAALISGDCAALIPPPTNPATVPQATQDIYVAIIRSLAATNNIPVIDIYDRFQTYTFSTALYSDNLHPNGLGYEVIGHALAKFLNVSGAGSANPPSMGLPLLIQTVANNTYTYVGYAGTAGTVLGLYEKARGLTTAGTVAIAINGTNITGLSAVVPTTAGSYNYATALNTFARGAQITAVYTSTSLVLDHSLTLDCVFQQVAL